MIFVPTGSLVGTFSSMLFPSLKQGISLISDTAICPLFLRRYSIVTPSLLHRKSIVSMEYLWINDVVSMEKQNSCEGVVRKRKLPVIFSFALSTPIV